jgi:AcrR family transcriptional regulator
MPVPASVRLMAARRDIALSRKELYERVWSEPLSVVAKQMGLSANALAKICNRLLVPYPPRGYWLRRGAGRGPGRPSLPPAPEAGARQVTISAKRAPSRRSRTRLDPAVRRDQLLDIAADLIAKGGLHAASMKQIAAAAGMSETQVYNYFGSRENLFVDIARREYARIQAARQANIAREHDHYSQVTAATRTYLRQIGERGGLIHMLLANPRVRDSIVKERRPQLSAGAHSHAQNLTKLYGVSPALALACTIVLSRLCVRTGKLLADKKIPLEAAERMCLSMVLRGSRAVLGNEGRETLGRAQSVKAA